MAFLVVFPGVAVTLHLAACPSSAGALLRGWLEGVPAAWEEMGQCTAAPDLTASVLEASVVVEEAVVWWWPPCPGCSSDACKHSVGLGALSTELCHGQGLRMREVTGGGSFLSQVLILCSVEIFFFQRLLLLKWTNGKH